MRRQLRSGNQSRRKGGKEGRLGDFGVGFHDFYLLQMLSDGWQEKQKTFRRSCRLAEETKGRKPSAVPLFFAPESGDALTRDTIISLHNNGRTRLHLLVVQRSRCSASSAGLYASCLAPPGTSLKGRSCLLLCVFAFDGLMITPVSGARQGTHSPKKS